MRLLIVPLLTVKVSASTNVAVTIPVVISLICKSPVTVIFSTLSSSTLISSAVNVFTPTSANVDMPVTLSLSLTVWVEFKCETSNSASVVTPT